MRRNHAFLMWTAAGSVFGVGVAAAQAAPTVTLSISAIGGNWTAYAQTDNSTDNAGLATFAVDVIGSDGATVSASYDIAPIGTTAKGKEAGFQEFPSNGIIAGNYDVTFPPGDGIGITAGQNVTYGSAHSTQLDLEIIQGFAQTAGSADGITWMVPTAIADGTYTGVGVLTVQSDTTIGHGFQTLNIVSNGQWVGPGNVSFDTVIPGSTITYIDVGPIISLNPVPIDPPGHAPPQYDIASTSASMVTPSSAGANDEIVFSGSPVLVHVIAPQTDEAFTFSNARAAEPISVLLRFTDTATGTDPANGSILADIENYIESNPFAGGITVTSAIPSSLASQFPGTTFDLMLTSHTFGSPGFAYLDFSTFSDSSVPAGDLAVSDIGIVPEPASAGLLFLGGIGLVCRRRRTSADKSKLAVPSDLQAKIPI